MNLFFLLLVRFSSASEHRPQRWRLLAPEWIRCLWTVPVRVSQLPSEYHATIQLSDSSVILIRLLTPLTVTQGSHHASTPVIVGVTNGVYCAALLATTFAPITWPLSLQHEYRCTRRWASIAQSKQSKYSRMLLQPVLRLISNARAVGEARNDSTFIRCNERGELEFYLVCEVWKQSFAVCDEQWRAFHSF